MCENQMSRCLSVFVSWRWLVGILAGTILTFATIAWAGSARLTELKHETMYVNVRLNRLEETVDKKLDIVINILENYDAGRSDPEQN